MPRAEIAARRLRQETETDDELDLDVMAVAHKAGAEVIYERLGGDVSGILVREGGRTVIGVNDRHAATRQRFTIAHELGHLRLHRGRSLLVDPVRINLRDARSSLATDLEEIEANSFAAELLMPRELVLREFRRMADAGPAGFGQIKTDLATAFDVSEEAMDYRLANLGLLRPP